jgi:hypothetical protein
MEWGLIRIFGIIIAGLGLPLFLFPEGGFLRGTPSMGTLFLIFSGHIIYRVADGKASEADIIKFYIQKNYSIEEAKERAKPTITILKERMCWPNYGLDDLIYASKQANFYLQKIK